MRWEQEQLQQKYAEATRQRDEIQVYLQYRVVFSTTPIPLPSIGQSYKLPGPSVYYYSSYLYLFRENLVFSATIIDRLLIFILINMLN